MDLACIFFAKYRDDRDIFFVKISADKLELVFGNIREEWVDDVKDRFKLFLDY